MIWLVVVAVVFVTSIPCAVALGRLWHIDEYGGSDDA